MYYFSAIHARSLEDATCQRPPQARQVPDPLTCRWPPGSLLASTTVPFYSWIGFDCGWERAREISDGKHGVAVREGKVFCLRGVFGNGG